MLKQNVSLVMVMLVILSLLASCAPAQPAPSSLGNQVTSQPADAGKKKIVEFAGFYSKDAPYAKEWIGAGETLMKENPSCEFRYTEYVGRDGDQAAMLRIKEGDPVDIFGGSNGFMTGGGELFKAGYVKDLTEEMKQPAYGQSSVTWWDSFNSGAQKGMRIGQNGPVVAVGYEQTTYVFWYNLDIYEKYGLKAPKTWDDLMANCQVLKENGIACIGGGGFPGYLSNWYEMILYRLMGEEKFNKLIYKTDPNLKWTDPEPLKAAQMFNDMIVKGYTSEGFVGGDFTANQMAYFTNKAANIFVGTWLMGEMKDSIPENFRQTVTYFPTITGYENVTPYESGFGNLNSFSVFLPGKNAKEEHSTECAVQYLKILTSKDYESKMVKDLGSLVPTVKGVPGPDNIPGISDLINNMKNWLPLAAGFELNNPALYSKMSDNVVKLGSQQFTPETFLEQMQKDWDEFYK